jgi:hypothetical protein
MASTLASVRTNGMKRRVIAKAGRCRRDKAEIDDRAVGVPMWALGILAKELGMNWQINPYKMANINSIFK